MSKQVVLLINLGSPDSPSVPDVRRYLREFLSDPRVLDGSWLARQFVLNVFILPTRPKNSAEAYHSIWLKEGSPLIVMSRRVQSLLQEKIELPVKLAMRYGNPSIPKVIEEILHDGFEEILLIPLYPHYAMSSYETVVERVKEVLAEKSSQTKLRVLPPFYQDEQYIRALVASAGPSLQKTYDHLLFSFHGLPERHLKLADCSKQHCLVKPNCCSIPHPVHDVCYRAQAFKTVEKFVELTKVPADKYSVSFQSRLGRDPWLRPYTDHVLQDLPSRGVKKLLIIAPAFVTDCLETLEELGMRGKELFLGAGGEEYTLIPCMNDHPLWVDALQSYTQQLQTFKTPLLA
jgi:protoporphyrin/coproporphyrin ferrochelatase